MAGFRRQAPEPDSVPNAIVGAARRIHIDRREEVQALRERGLDERQMLAWRYYDLIGEVKAAYNYYAAVGSRVRFFAAFTPEGNLTVPPDIGDVGNVDRSLVSAARYELNKLNSGRGGQSSFIRTMILNLLVAGEGYIVGANGKWSFRSTSELRFEQDNKVRMVISRYQRGTYMHYLPEDAFIARVWRMHPQYSDDADAALHGVLAECGELVLLNRLIRATARSRLNAGLLYVADELRFQKSSDPDGELAEPDVDPFEEELTLALTDPIGDTDSPSEIVPLIIRGPAEFAQTGLNYIDISRNFDPNLIQRHDQTLQRIQQALEVPQDVLGGLSKVRYSNVGAISQDFLKSYLEPMATLIAEALTTVFLRPALIARGFDPTDVEKVSVWYDPTAVVLQPDKSDAANSGYQQMTLSGAAWRKAHGFSESDAPTAEELVRRVGLTGALPPNAIVDMMRELAPELVKRAEKLSGHSMDQPPPGAGAQAPGSGSAADTNPTRSIAHSNGPGGNGPGTGISGPRPARPHDPMKGVLPPGQGVTKAPPPNPEGDLPSRAEHALHVPSERLDQAALIEMLQALTAAATAEAESVREANRRLELALEAERRLRDQLSVSLNDLVKRALERAGARTVSKVRGDAKLKSLVVDVPLAEAFASVPSEARAEFALDEKALIRDTIEAGRDNFAQLVAAAQRTGWTALGPFVRDAMQSGQSGLIAQAWQWLQDELISLATHFLNRPKSDPNQNYVPMQVIRDAATLAGGGAHETAPKGSVVPRSVPSDSGRAVLSTAALDAMQSVDNPQRVEFETHRYRWVYGISENHFEPHLALDGHLFNTWEDRELAALNPGEWPFTSHYYPGDHNGCRCDWLPAVLDPRAVNRAERGDTSAPIAASAANVAP